MDDYYIYKMQEGDTLNSIAKANNITLKELIQFHNLHCGYTQYIINEILPSYVSTLYIIRPELQIHAVLPLAELPPYQSSLIYKEKLQQIYEINIKTGVVYLGNKIADNENVLNWQIDLNTPEHGYLRKIELENSKKEMSPNIALVNAVMHAMNDATKNLLFKLTPLGELDALVNSNEVQKLWKTNKIEQLKTIELNIPELSAMFKICDEEFENLPTSLQQNLLYTLFFLPIGRTEFTDKNTLYFLANKQVLSQFFQPFFIPYELRCHTNIVDGDIELQLTSKINKEKLMLDFYRIFKDKYAEMSQSDFDFNFNIEGYYHFYANGLLKSAKIYVREQVNNNCFYIAEYGFGLIN